MESIDAKFSTHADVKGQCQAAQRFRMEFRLSIQLKNGVHIRVMNKICVTLMEQNNKTHACEPTHRLLHKSVSNGFTTNTHQTSFQIIHNRCVTCVFLVILDLF